MNALCFVYVYQSIRWHGLSQETLWYTLFNRETFTIATNGTETNTISALCTCLISKAAVHWIELQPQATAYRQSGEEKDKDETDSEGIVGGAEEQTEGHTDQGQTF